MKRPREKVWQKEGDNMKAAVLSAAMAVLLALPAGAETGSGEVLGSLTAVSGDVQVGSAGNWTAAAVGGELREGQVIRTGPDSKAAVLFGEDIAASLGAGIEVEVSDLLLKTRLENMRSRVSAPVEEQKVEMQVTPTTGVRGTEQTGKKAEELKREHYWNEEPKQAQ